MAVPIIISAIANNNVIGDSKTNSMPWPKQKEDMKWFQEVTDGYTVAMGNKTFQSMGCVELCRRHNIILSSNPQESFVHYYASNMYELEEMLRDDTEDVCFIIGGRSLYEHFLPKVNQMYLTHFTFDAEGNVFFPEWNKEEWRDELVRIIPNGEIHKYTRINPVDEDIWYNPWEEEWLYGDDPYFEDDYEEDDCAL